MTETMNTSESTARESFILYWGDMGSQWGVNRSVAQIHALLYLSPTPLNAEQISEELGIARSNVSNSLKELAGWKLIRRVPIPGDRREHFVAETDVWEMALRIAHGRKAREVDPAIEAIDACLKQARQEQGMHPVVLQRMEAMQEFLASADSWYSQMLKIPTAKLSMVMKMGDKIVSLLGIKGNKPD